MEQLNIFEIIDKAPELKKKIEVEITKKHGKANLVYRLEGTEEEIKEQLTAYFERVKMYLDIVEYKFINL